MDAKQLTKPVEPETKGGSGWLVAVAAFAGVIVIAGLIAVLANRDAVEPSEEPVPTTQAAPPTTAAQPEPADEGEAVVAVSAADASLISAYQDAVNSADLDRIESFLAEGFRVTDQETIGQGWFTSRDGWINEQLLFALESSTVTYSDCEMRGDAVSCLERWTGTIPKAVMGVDWQYRMEFTIRDGLIDSMHGQALVWPTSGAHQGLYESVIEWASGVAEGDVAAELSRCTIDVGAADLEIRDLCLQWVELWLEAGRP